MADLNGLISDPDFQSLPPERKRALLESMGADPQFIEQNTGAGRALGGVGGISATPKFQQDISIPVPKAPVGPLAALKGEIKLPVSPEFLTDLLPGVLGAVTTGASALAGPLAPAAAGLLGGLGSAGGEAIRQEIRDLMGFAPGTGVTQELLELDPSSREAKVASLLAEGAGGAAAEFMGARGLAKYPERKELAKRRFVDAITDPKTSAKEKDALLEAMRPALEEEIPAGTGGMVMRRAETKLGPAGEAVGEIYTGPAGERAAGYGGGRRELLDEINRLTETPTATREREPLAGRTLMGEPVPVEQTPEVVVSSPAYKDKAMVPALRERERDLAERTLKRKLYGEATGTRQDISAREVWEQRQQAATEARRASSEVFLPGRDAKKLVPKAKAAMKEYDGLRKTLNAVVPEGKKADDIYHAWATMLDTASEKERSHFLGRWAAMGLAGGRTGRVLGLAASVPSVWRTTLAKSGDMMAEALKAGDTAHARQIFRSVLDAMAQPETEPLEKE